MKPSFANPTGLNILYGVTFFIHFSTSLFKPKKVLDADFDDLVEQIGKGKVKTHLEKQYSYKEIPEAIAYIE